MKFEFATANRIIFGPGRFGEIGEIAELLEVSLVPLPANPAALAEQNAEGMITKSIPDPQAFAEHFNEALLKLTIAEMDLPELIAEKKCRLLGIIVEEDEDGFHF